MSQHQEFSELIAPLALHALDDKEQRAVLDHVEGCEQCRADLDEYRETAGLMGSGASLPPEGIWQRIEAEIVSPPPPIELVRKQRGWRVASAAVAASVATLLAVGGAWAVWPDDAQIEQVENQLAASARQSTDARTVSLDSPDGGTVAEVVILDDGDSYLVNKALPSLDGNRTYQLWAISTDKTVSAAVLGEAPSIATFNTSPGVQAVAITEEVSGGVVASSQTPIAVGQLGST